MFFAKVHKPQSHHKATTKTTSKTQTLDFQRFCDFYCGFWGIGDIYI
jgi:hypothetical protein